MILATLPRWLGYSSDFLERVVLLNRLKSLFADDEDVLADPSERRVDPRRKVLLKAEVFPILGYADLKIVNASKTGFAAETTALLQPSHPLIFAVEGNDFYQGTIRWVRGRRFGVDMADALAILGYSDEVDPGFLLSHQPRPRRYSVDLRAALLLAPPPIGQRFATYPNPVSVWNSTLL
jgi:hypothetical protein